MNKQLLPEEQKLEKVLGQIAKMEADILEKQKKLDDLTKQKEGLEAVIAQKKAAPILEAMKVQGLSIEEVLALIGGEKPKTASATVEPADDPKEEPTSVYRVRGSLDEILNG